MTAPCPAVRAARSALPCSAWSRGHGVLAVVQLCSAAGCGNCSVASRRRSGQQGTGRQPKVPVSLPARQMPGAGAADHRQHNAVCSPARQPQRSAAATQTARGPGSTRPLAPCLLPPPSLTPAHHPPSPPPPPSPLPLQTLGLTPWACATPRAPAASSPPSGWPTPRSSTAAGPCWALPASWHPRFWPPQVSSPPTPRR